MSDVMKHAPKDRNILIKTEMHHYVDGEWKVIGTQWVECFWGTNMNGTRLEWREYCGNHKTFTTRKIYPLEWAYLP